MTFAEFAQRLGPLRRIGSGCPDIDAVSHDSRHLAPGTAFFALRGTVRDGHAFIDQAVAAGAGLIVMEEEHPLPEGVCGLIVHDTRIALATAAAALHGVPAGGMTLVGVTGTNGKTTTTYLLEALLRSAGRSPAVLGTVSYRYGATVYDASHTTPDAVALCAHLAAFAAAGADAAVMEVSSHALDQHRVDGLRYHAAIYTNLTPEHLDYHPDMEAYYAAKRRLFTELLTPDGRGAICVDDDYGRRLAGECPTAITCGRDASAAVHPLELAESVAGIHGTFASPKGPIRIDSPLVGPFNVQNLLCAVAGGIALDLPVAAIETGIAAARTVPGRLERIENDRAALILVDYAHTGDALEKALAAVATLKPQRIFTVFGCGGDRDRRKRPVMGEIAARLSHLAIVTSDNPRTEEPLAIIGEIETGVRRIHPQALSPEAARSGATGYIVIPDRRIAINFAVSLLDPGDILLVAGKGHEDYQIIGRDKIHFDDREELRAALAGASAC